MGVLLGLIVCGLWIWFFYYFAERFYDVAKMKGHCDKKYFWIPFWFGLAGWLLVIALPDRGNSAAAVSDELPEL